MIFDPGTQRSVKCVSCSQHAQRILDTDDKRGHQFFDTVPLFESGLASPANSRCHDMPVVGSGPTHCQFPGPFSWNPGGRCVGSLIRVLAGGHGRLWSCTGQKRCPAEPSHPYQEQASEWDCLHSPDQTRCWLNTTSWPHGGPVEPRTHSASPASIPDPVYGEIK